MNDPDVLRPSVVRQVLQELAFRPRKALGQNFLIDRNILDLIMDAAGVQPTDAVLEIGPGLGAITGRLVESARRVVAVEKDEQLHAFLQTQFAQAANFQLILADMLKIKVDQFAWPVTGVMTFDRVVSNLPYAVGTRILVDLVQAERAPQTIVVTVQKEVGERLVAGPGTPEYGLLSIWVQQAYDVELIHTVGPRCFLPEPEVRSAIMRLQRRAGAVRASAAFYKLTRAGFAQRRKQVVRSLAGEGRAVEQIRVALEAVGVITTARPENLTAEQWVEMARRLG